MTSNKQQLDRLLQKYTKKNFVVNYPVKKHQAEIQELESQIDDCVKKIRETVRDCVFLVYFFLETLMEILEEMTGKYRNP